MLNSYGTELLKLRKNKIYIICLLITLAASILIVLKDLVLVEAPADYITWAFGACAVNLLFLPIMSSLIITFLIQREYQEQTLINVLTAPVSRIAFISSKVLTWFTWYALAAVLNMAIYTAGYYLIYPDEFTWTGLSWLLSTLLKMDMFGFIAGMPLIWIAVMQRRAFFPTVLIGLAFTGLQLAASSVSEDMLKLAMAVPWTAAPIISMFDVPVQYEITGLCSVLAAGIIGFVGAVISFKRQEQ